MDSPEGISLSDSYNKRKSDFSDTGEIYAQSGIKKSDQTFKVYFLSFFNSSVLHLFADYILSSKRSQVF